MTGIWPILYAFFGPDGRLDRDAMRRQAGAALSHGAPGVAVLGLATEVDKLSPAERLDVIRWAVDDLAGRAPLAVTIAGASVDAQRELAARAVELGASRLILQPPPLVATGAQPEDFYVDFFAAVMDGQPVPVGLQNAPEYLGVGLSPPALLALAARRDAFAFVTGEAASTASARTIAALGERLPVLNGRGGLELVENLQAGCAGMIVAPDTADHQHAVWTLWAAGEREAALERYAAVLPAIVFVMQSLATLVCYGKRIAAWRMGIDVVHDRAPALAPTGFGLARAREHARRLGALPLARR
ncbi:MAG: dihydrodipicolinate synthase family protein [Burkholderiaceae bacterium]